MGACCADALGAWASALPAGREARRARYWKPLAGGMTRCELCPNGCVRPDGGDGRCRARGNRGGVYRTLTYGRPSVIAVDPVEKCPLNHFQLRGHAFSIATAGCNLSCQYCHNWAFSQVGPQEAPKVYSMTPREVVAKAVENHCDAIAYFYTEPVVFFEYMMDIATLARKSGLKNVMVTAGYISPEPLREILPHLDAVTFGLKGFDEAYYRDYVGGELKYVLRSAEILAQTKRVWWEVVTLLVPSLNDDMAQVARLAKWLRNTAGSEVPLHFTRFRPEYRLKRLPMTPSKTLTLARETAMAQGLKYVYLGNLPGHQGADTVCPRCSRTIVERIGFKVLERRMRGNKCAYCSAVIKGVWL